MAGENLNSVITSFSPEGEFLAVLNPNGNVKIWNTNDGSPLAEWKSSEEGISVKISCMACSFVGKKRRKGQATCLVVLGTDGGYVLAINAFTGETKWKYSGHHPGGIAALSVANKGRKIFAVSTDGMACEINSETGELMKELKVSKKSLASSVCSCNEKVLATASSNICILSLEDGKRLLKFAADSGAVQHLCMSDDAKAIITSGLGEKNLYVWECSFDSRAVSHGPVLSMKHSPISMECKKGGDEEEGLVVLSVSESGVAYIWNLTNFSEEDVKPIKITVKANKAANGAARSGRIKKSHSSIFAAQLHTLDADGQVRALVAYGAVDCPQFSLLDITSPGEDIVIAATDKTGKASVDVQENGVNTGKALDNVELEAVAEAVQKEKSNKKRAASDLESENTQDFLNDEPTDGIQTDDDLNEPTMGEKLASLNILDYDEAKSHEKVETSPQVKPPSADSVHVLLKQALHADDRTLLLDCLNRRDEKVVANSISQLNPSDVFKLLESLISIIQSRGAVLVCALPWLRSLLLQHASSIMSQESSLIALNSLFQLIESRISTFNAAVQLSSCIDLLYTGTIDDADNEEEIVEPFIYEDKDDSDEEGSEEAMETDDNSGKVDAYSDVSDFEGSDGLSDL